MPVQWLPAMSSSDSEQNWQLVQCTLPIVAVLVPVTNQKCHYFQHDGAGYITNAEELNTGGGGGDGMGLVLGGDGGIY